MVQNLFVMVTGWLLLDHSILKWFISLIVLWPISVKTCMCDVRVVRLCIVAKTDNLVCKVIIWTCFWLDAFDSVALLYSMQWLFPSFINVQVYDFRIMTRSALSVQLVTCSYVIVSEISDSLLLWRPIIECVVSETSLTSMHGKLLTCLCHYPYKSGLWPQWP